jgi:hypothetical protein
MKASKIVDVAPGIFNMAFSNTLQTLNPINSDLIIRVYASSSRSLKIEAKMSSAQSGISGITAIRLEPELVNQVLASISRMSLGYEGSLGGYDSLESLRKLGSQLFSVLFDGELSVCYRQILDAEAKGLETRIILEMDPNLVDLAWDSTGTSLTQLPWELLFDHNRNTFLSLSLRTPLVRRRSDFKYPANDFSLDGSRPLKMLFVQADRDGYANTAEDIALVKGIKSNFSENEGDSSQPVEVEMLENPSVAELLDKLTQIPYDILHLSGSGNFAPGDYSTRRSCPETLLLNSTSATPWSEFFARVTSIEPINRPKIVFLSTDYSARFAWELAEYIPCIAAINGLLSTEFTTQFEQKFYKSLLSGDTFETAMVRSRQDLDCSRTGVKDWGLIVGYSQISDTHMIEIFERNKLSADEVSGSAWRELTKQERLKKIYGANKTALENRRSLTRGQDHDLDVQIGSIDRKLTQLDET